MRKLGQAVEILVVIICLPFYTIAVPLVCFFQWCQQRRPVRDGQEVTHWPAKGLREDLLVVDTSRISEGLVGVKRRRWGVLGAKGVSPPYPDSVEFITVKSFWVPRPLRIFSGT